MRSWLEEFEGGASIASIAKRVKHDIRTVTRGIEEARHESDARSARSDMIKDSFENIRQI